MVCCSRAGRREVPSLRMHESYTVATPEGASQRPNEVRDLLRDPRFPGRMVRHLRSFPHDPITGSAAWGIVRGPGGIGIDGFHSLSELPVLRREYPPEWADFDGTRTYRDWVFRADER
jgi:hypothetical protein